MSAHALLALAYGRPIVRLEWVDESVKAGRALDPVSFLLHNPALEKKVKFKMQTSFARAQRGRLLEGKEGGGGPVNLF